ncbi:MAG: NAD(P)H-dependent oxidoreductase subunit E [Spirochaetales bacterium]|nr:NAD(P)H-dependent oxidoreductase subunit E [Spirochaetales bacterium]
MIMTKDLDSLLNNYPKEKQEYLIPILQDIQNTFGYLSKESIAATSRHFNIPASKIYGVATFYNQFKLHPPGKYHIQICRGTACHVKGSLTILEKLTRELKIGPNETTKDGLFSIEVVACIGACGLAPVMAVNGKYYAHLNQNDITTIIKKYREAATEQEGNEK